MAAPDKSSLTSSLRQPREVKCGERKTTAPESTPVCRGSAVADVGSLRSGQKRTLSQPASGTEPRDKKPKHEKKKSDDGLEITPKSKGLKEDTSERSSATGIRQSTRIGIKSSLIKSKDETKESNSQRVKHLQKSADTGAKPTKTSPASSERKASLGKAVTNSKTTADESGSKSTVSVEAELKRLSIDGFSFLDASHLTGRVRSRDDSHSPASSSDRGKSSSQKDNSLKKKSLSKLPKCSSGKEKGGRKDGKAETDGQAKDNSFLSELRRLQTTEGFWSPIALPSDTSRDASPSSASSLDRSFRHSSRPQQKKTESDEPLTKGNKASGIPKESKTGSKIVKMTGQRESRALDRQGRKSGMHVTREGDQKVREKDEPLITTKKSIGHSSSENREQVRAKGSESLSNSSASSCKGVKRVLSEASLPSDAKSSGKKLNKESVTTLSLPAGHRGNTERASEHEKLETLSGPEFSIGDLLVSGELKRLNTTSGFWAPTPDIRVVLGQHTRRHTGQRASPVKMDSRLLQLRKKTLQNLKKTFQRESLKNSSGAQGIQVSKKLGNAKAAGRKKQVPAQEKDPVQRPVKRRHFYFGAKKKKGRKGIPIHKNKLRAPVVETPADEAPASPCLLDRKSDEEEESDMPESLVRTSSQRLHKLREKESVDENMVNPERARRGREVKGAQESVAGGELKMTGSADRKSLMKKEKVLPASKQCTDKEQAMSDHVRLENTVSKLPVSSSNSSAVLPCPSKEKTETFEEKEQVDSSLDQSDKEVKVENDLSSKLNSKLVILTPEERIANKPTELLSDKEEKVRDMLPLLSAEASEKLSVKTVALTRNSKKQQDFASALTVETESVSLKPPTIKDATSSVTQDQPHHNSGSDEMEVNTHVTFRITESGDEKSQNELQGNSTLKPADDAVKTEDVCNQSGHGESVAVPMLKAEEVSSPSDIKLDDDKVQALHPPEKMASASNAIEAVTGLNSQEAVGASESSKDGSHRVVKFKKTFLRSPSGKFMKSTDRGVNSSSAFQEKDVLRRVNRRRTSAWQRGILKKAAAVRKKDKPVSPTFVASKESNAVTTADAKTEVDARQECTQTEIVGEVAGNEGQIGDSKEKDVEHVSCSVEEENLRQEKHAQCPHTTKVSSSSGDDDISSESAVLEIAADTSTLNCKQTSLSTDLCISSDSSAIALESASVKLQQNDDIKDDSGGTQETQTRVSTSSELVSECKEMASVEAPAASRTDLVQSYQGESMSNSGDSANVQCCFSSEVLGQSDGAGVSESAQLSQKKGSELIKEDSHSSSSGPGLRSGEPVVLDAGISKTGQALHKSHSGERSTCILPSSELNGVSSESVPTRKKLPDPDGIDQVAVPVSEEDRPCCVPPLETGNASGETPASSTTPVEKTKDVEIAGINGAPTLEEAKVKPAAPSEVLPVLEESDAQQVPVVAEAKSLQTSNATGLTTLLANKSSKRRKNCKSGKAMLKRLQTNANLANAVLDYKSLVTRARRGVLSLKDTPSLGKHKLVKDASAKVKAQAEAKALSELRISSPGQTVGKRPRGRPRKYAIGSVPLVNPAGSKVSAPLTGTPKSHSPPLLSPQNFTSAPEHLGEAVANTEVPNAPEDFVKEGVDDTDFHLIFSAASEDESSPSKEKEKGVGETAVPFSLGSKMKEQHGVAVGGEANEKNEAGRKKIKGKRGRPPGLPMTKVDRYFSDAASPSETQLDKAVTLKDVPLTVVPMFKGKGKFLVSKSLPSPHTSPRTARKSLQVPMTSLGSVQEEPSRKFEFRKKTTRSPLEMLRMKRKQEEARYDMEEEKRQARILLLREKRNARISCDEYGVEEDEGVSLFPTRPCAVVLSDFVKKLQLDSMDSPHEDISEAGSQSPEYSEDQDDADWCADLEDVQDDDEDWVIQDGSAGRPHIPRLKLKRVMKKAPAALVKKYKSRSLTSELIPSEQEPLKLVIKTEVPSDVEERLKSSSNSSVVDLTTVETTGFEGSYVDFLNGKQGDDFMSRHKANKRKTYTTFPCSSQNLKEVHSSVWASSASGDVKQARDIVHEEHQVTETSLDKARLTTVQPQRLAPSHSLNSSTLSGDAPKKDGPVQPLSAAEDDEEEDVLILDLEESCSAEKVAGTTSAVHDGEKSSKHATGASEMNIMLDSYKPDDFQGPKKTSLAGKDCLKIQGSGGEGQKAMSSEKEKETQINSVEEFKAPESGRSKASALTKESFDAVSAAPSPYPRESTLSAVTLVSTQNTSGGEEVQVSPRIGIVSTHKAVDATGSPALDKGEDNCQDVTAASAPPVPSASGDVAVLDSGERLEKNSPNHSQTQSSKTQSATAEESPRSGASPVQSSLYSADHDRDDETEGIGKLKIILPSDRVPSGKYICKRCSFSTGFKLTIESHIYSHFPGVQFRCAYCQSEFSSMAATCSHLKNTHTSCESKLYISRHIEESNFYVREAGIISEENAKTLASQISSGATGGSSPPVIISVLVSGARGGRSAIASRRFVCTHCGFSTNKREDADQHVWDLHSSHSIYACILCNESVYYSEAEIKQHCLTVHPSRHRPYRKLPDFYDADQLGMMDKAGSLEERSNIFDRVSSIFPAEDAEVEAGSIDHRQKAKDYLYLQEGWKEKRSAEADSTTAADFIEDSVADGKDSDVVESSELTVNSESVAPPMSRSAVEENVSQTVAGSCLNDRVITSSATVADQELPPPQRQTVTQETATSDEGSKDMQTVSVKTCQAEGMELSCEEIKTPSGVDQDEECQETETLPASEHVRLEEGAVEDALEDKSKSDVQAETETVNKSVVPALENSMAAETCQAEPDGENETGLKIVQVVSLRGLGQFSPVTGPPDAEIEDPESSAENLRISSGSLVPESPLQGDSSVSESIQASAVLCETSTAEAVASASHSSSIPRAGEKSHDQDLSAEAERESVDESNSTAKSSSSRPPQSSSAQPLSGATSTPTSVTSTFSSSQSKPPTSSPMGGLPLSYRCNACKVHTPYLLMMVKHLKAKHPSIRCFACPYCKATYSFNSQKQLRHHVKNQHPEKMDKNEISLSEEAKKFVEAMVLPNGPECIRVGNRIVLEEDIHTCTYCSLKMTSLTSVYEHLNEKHTDLFEFVCPVCQSYKNKSLEKVSDHCRRVHKSDLDTDKVHVSVPKNLFTVLTCISKNAKYIEKSLSLSSGEKAGTSTTTATTSTSTTTSTAAAAVTSAQASTTSSSVEKGGAGEPKTVSTPIQSTATGLGVAAVATSAVTAQVVLSSPAPVVSAISPAVLPIHPITEAIPSEQQPSQSPQSAPVVSLISQTPLIAIPIVAGQPGTSPRIAFSSALFDTSSLTIPPQVTFKPGSKPVAVIQSNGASLQHLQQALTQQTVQKATSSSSSSSSSSRNLPVLNVPTIRPRSSSTSGAGASQKKPAASPAPSFSGSSISEPITAAHRPSFSVVSLASSVIPQGTAIHSGQALTSATANMSNQISRPSSTEAPAISLDNLPEEEPTPDAFKIFNLRPSSQSASPGQTSAAVSPSVFPPVSAAQLGTGYIQGPVAGFPAGMVISPNLLPRPFPYPQSQTSVQSMMAPVATPSSSAQQRATQRSMLLASFQQKQQIDHQQQMKRQRQMKRQMAEAQRQRALLQQASSSHHLTPQRPQRDDSQAHKQQRQQQQQQQPLAIQPAHQQQPSISGQVYQPGGHSTHRVFSPPFPSVPASPSSALSHPSGLSPSSSRPAQGKKGVYKRSSSTYQCPYCPKVVPLRALDVATHIHQHHPGQPVTFKKFYVSQ